MKHYEQSEKQLRKAYRFYRSNIFNEALPDLYWLDDSEWFWKVVKGIRLPACISNPDRPLTDPVNRVVAADYAAEHGFADVARILNEPGELLQIACWFSTSGLQLVRADYHRIFARKELPPHRATRVNLNWGYLHRSVPSGTDPRYVIDYEGRSR